MMQRSWRTSPWFGNRLPSGELPRKRCVAKLQRGQQRRQNRSVLLVQLLPEGRELEDGEYHQLQEVHRPEAPAHRLRQAANPAAPSAEPGVALEEASAPPEGGHEGSEWFLFTDHYILTTWTSFLSCPVFRYVKAAFTSRVLSCSPPHKFVHRNPEMP